jgi:hypothetical protein
MGLNDISNNFLIFLKKFMNDLYDINFIFNDEIRKIRIRYDVFITCAP